MQTLTKSLISDLLNMKKNHLAVMKEQRDNSQKEYNHAENMISELLEDIRALETDLGIEVVHELKVIN